MWLSLLKLATVYGSRYDEQINKLVIRKVKNVALTSLSIFAGEKSRFLILILWFSH